MWNTDLFPVTHCMCKFVWWCLATMWDINRYMYRVLALHMEVWLYFLPLSITTFWIINQYNYIKICNPFDLLFLFDIDWEECTYRIDKHSGDKIWQGDDSCEFAWEHGGMKKQNKTLEKNILTHQKKIYHFRMREKFEFINAHHEFLLMLIMVGSSSSNLTLPWL